MPYKDPIKQQEATRKWRLEHRAQEQERLRNRYQERIAWYREYKKTLQCNRCPESHWACLEFHHNDPNQKDFTIGDALATAMSKETIIEEIAKCEVLCSNCHRKEHASR